MWKLRNVENFRGIYTETTFVRRCQQVRMCRTLITSYLDNGKLLRKFFELVEKV